MALIQLDTKDGSVLGNPPSGDFYVFLDSSNSDKLTIRDSAGVDQVITAASGTGVLTPTINGTNMVEVSQESDFGAASAGTINLTANTTYIVRGQVTCTNQLVVAGDGISVMAFDREKNCLIYTGTASLFQVTDRSFLLRGLHLKATDAAGKVLEADNINTGSSANFYGRTKVLEIFECKVANSTNVMTVEGFELVDISNTLFWYISDGTIGCQFKSVRHLEISSCEFYNWFEEGNQANLDTYRQIELLADSAVGVGNGVVNISSSIIHPEITQDGLYIDASSTTGFGTISANTFVDTNLTTGLLANFDYDVQNTYIIQANQSITNGNSKGIMQITGNSVELTNSTASGPPYTRVIADANFVGGAGPTNPISFPVAQRITTSSTNGTITYQSKIDGNFAVILNATVGINANGTFTITIEIRQNGTPLPFKGEVIVRNSGGNYIFQTASLSAQGVATQGDVFDIQVSCDQANNVQVSEMIFNGFQF
jgi:hypothetical protein